MNHEIEIITWKYIMISIRYEHLKPYNCVKIIWIRLEHSISYKCVQKNS